MTKLRSLALFTVPALVLVSGAASAADSLVTLKSIDSSFVVGGGGGALDANRHQTTVSEASGSNLAQEEVIERPQLRQFGLSLGGELAVGERLAVGGGIAVTEDLDRGRDQGFSLRLSYRP